MKTKATFLVISRAHVNILFIIKVKILVLIEIPPTMLNNE